MKYLVSVLLWCILAVHAECQTNYSGGWKYTSDYLSFTLELTQNGDTILGNHCAIADAGNFIDCHNPEENSKTLSGIVQGDSIFLIFTSQYCMEKGNAIIKKLNANQILWRITKGTHGLSYLPDRAILEKYIPDLPDKLARRE